MGVISHNRNRLPNVQAQNELFPIDYLIESPLSTDLEDEDEVESIEDQHQHVCNLEIYDFDIYASPQRRRVRNAPKILQIKNLNPISRDKRHWGARRLRRWDNSKLLGVHIDDDEICEDFSDMLPDTTNAFSQLFLEKDKMQAWTDFSRKNEDEQEAILYGRDKKHAPVAGSKFDNDDSTPSCSESLQAKLTVLHDSPERRYRKIDKNLRFLLKHKPTVWERLREIEADLLSSFNDNPRTVFIGHLESGFDRILLHAVAQYLNLRSISFDDRADGLRKTKVFNCRQYFTQPDQQLTAYLEHMFDIKAAV